MLKSILEAKSIILKTSKHVEINSTFGDLILVQNVELNIHQVHDMKFYSADKLKFN
jgi:hypothetical protein